MRVVKGMFYYILRPYDRSGDAPPHHKDASLGLVIGTAVFVLVVAMGVYYAIR